MFDYGVLADHLSVEHLDEPLSDFVPGWNRADIVQHWAALTKAHSFLDLLDETNASKVHVVSFLTQSRLIVDALW